MEEGHDTEIEWTCEGDLKTVSSHEWKYCEYRSTGFLSVIKGRHMPVCFREGVFFNTPNWVVPQKLNFKELLSQYSQLSLTVLRQRFLFCFLLLNCYIQ